MPAFQSYDKQSAKLWEKMKCY